MSKQAKKRRGRSRPGIWVLILAALLLAAAIFFWPDLRDTGREFLYPLEYEAVLYQYSGEYELDPFLVMGLIYAESSFDPEAVSGAGAVGLMQLMPDTAAWLAEKMDLSYSEEDLKNPVYNIRMGCYYLNLLLQLFPVQDTALAAYNAGMGNVQNWLEDSRYSGDGSSLDSIPFQETETYVERVNTYRETYRELYGPSASHTAGTAA